MLRKRLTGLVLFLVVLVSPVAAAPYVIGPGDVLNIAVWRDDALTRTVTVLPDGNIAFPLIGQVKAGGCTVSALQAELGRRLERFVPDPELTVAVQEVGSMDISVLGRVSRPGRFMLTSNVDVLQALAMAGGLTPYAEEKKIRVFRRGAGETTVLPFNYRDVSRGKHLEQNITLKRGDVIVVP